MEAGSTTSGDRPGGASDHDAPWRPGFEGWDDDVFGGAGVDDPGGFSWRRSDDAGIEWSREHDQAEPEPWVPERRVRTQASARPSGPPVARLEDSPSSTVTGSVVLVGIGVACALLLTAVVVVAIRPDGSESAAPRTAPLIPEQVDSLWSSDVDGALGDVAIGANVVVTSTNSGSGLTAYDVLTGDERWTRALPDIDRDIDRLVVIDDSVVVQHRDPTGVSVVTVVDASTGNHRWSSNDDASHGVVETDPGHAILRRFRDGSLTRAEVLDPTTGLAEGDAITVSDVSVPGPFLAAETTQGDAVIWSIESGPLDVPAVESFGMRTITPFGDSVVGLDLEARIVAFDDGGRRADERPFVSDAPGEFTSRADLVGVVDGSDIAIIASGSSLGFTVTDGLIENVWQRAGRATRPVDTVDGPFAVIVGPDAASGEINATIIDPVTGETVIATDAGTTREIDPLLGHNSYVVAPEIGAVGRVFSARRYGGGEVWSLTVPQGAEVQIAHGIAVVVDRRADGADISVWG